MALTQSDWTLVGKSNGKKAWQCSVTATTAENDAYTKKTPGGLDLSKPFTLVVSTSAASDAAAVPLDCWVGYKDDFAISGDSTTVTATSGANYKVLTDDIGYSAASVSVFAFDPMLPVADVCTIAAIANGYKIRTPAASYLAFNLDGGSTLLAHTTTYTIIQ